MFEIDSKKYMVKLSIGKIKAVESVTGRSFMSDWLSSKGMLPISLLESIFRICMYSVEESKYINVTKASELFEKYLNESGYAAAINEVMEAMDRDVPFLLRTN